MLEDCLKVLMVPIHHLVLQIDQEILVVLVVVLVFIIQDWVDLHLVLLSLVLLATLQILVGVMVVVEVVVQEVHKTHFTILAAAVVPVVLVNLVEMDHIPLEEQVEMVTYFLLFFNYQHQPWHLNLTEIQDQVVVLTG